MTELSQLGRREFLAPATGLLTAGFLGESAAALEKSAGRSIVQSQRLPAPSVKLPTDRLPAPQGRKKRIIARTLLTTGVLDALHDSRQAGGKRVPTSHLRDLRYTPAEDFPMTS